jgi:hypothetical protein
VKLATVTLPAPLYARLLDAAGGSRLVARLLLERAIERAIAAEGNRLEARHRAEVSRHRRRFGWAW